MKKVLSCFLSICLVWGSVDPSNLYAQTGSSVVSAQIFEVPLLKGLQIVPQKPFEFHFLIDAGVPSLTVVPAQDQSDYLRLIRYFLAAMTVPDGDLWVNLSPAEPDRIIPQALGRTGMGWDLLNQDYQLKQLTSRLLSPDSSSGKTFWEKVYQKAYEEKGITDIPMESFHKVWIVPESARVYEAGDKVFITESRLKVMTERDYLARQSQPMHVLSSHGRESQVSNDMKSLIQEVIIPIIEQEVNEGDVFSPLRQIYHSVILAKWYKKHFRQSLLGRNYIDQNHVEGIRLNDESFKDGIYQKYLELFRQGSQGILKEDYDPLNQEMVARQYVVGGMIFDGVLENDSEITPAMLNEDYVNLDVRLDQASLADDEFQKRRDNLYAYVQELEKELDFSDAAGGVKKISLSLYNWLKTLDGAVTEYRKLDKNLKQEVLRRMSQAMQDDFQDLKRQRGSLTQNDFLSERIQDDDLKILNKSFLESVLTNDQRVAYETDQYFLYLEILERHYAKTAYLTDNLKSSQLILLRRQIFQDVLVVKKHFAWMMQKGLQMYGQKTTQASQSLLEAFAEEGQDVDKTNILTRIFSHQYAAYSDDALAQMFLWFDQEKPNWSIKKTAFKGQSIRDLKIRDLRLKASSLLSSELYRSIFSVYPTIKQFADEKGIAYKPLINLLNRRSVNLVIDGNAPYGIAFAFDEEEAKHDWNILWNVLDLNRDSMDRIAMIVREMDDIKKVIELIEDSSGDEVEIVFPEQEFAQELSRSIKQKNISPMKRIYDLWVEFRRVLPMRVLPEGRQRLKEIVDEIETLLFFHDPAIYRYMVPFYGDIGLLSYAFEKGYLKSLFNQPLNILEITMGLAHMELAGQEISDQIPAAGMNVDAIEYAKQLIKRSQSDLRGLFSDLPDILEEMFKGKSEGYREHYDAIVLNRSLFKFDVNNPVKVIRFLNSLLKKESQASEAGKLFIIFEKERPIPESFVQAMEKFGFQALVEPGSLLSPQIDPQMLNGIQNSEKLFSKIKRASFSVMIFKKVGDAPENPDVDPNDLKTRRQKTEQEESLADVVDAEPIDTTVKEDPGYSVPGSFNGMTAVLIEPSKSVAEVEVPVEVPAVQETPSWEPENIFEHLDFDYHFLQVYKDIWVVSHPLWMLAISYAAQRELEEKSKPGAQKLDDLGAPRFNFVKEYFETYQGDYEHDAQMLLKIFLQGDSSESRLFISHFQKMLEDSQRQDYLLSPVLEKDSREYLFAMTLAALRFFLLSLGRDERSDLSLSAEFLRAEFPDFWNVIYENSSLQNDVVAVSCFIFSEVLLKDPDNKLSQEFDDFFRELGKKAELDDVRKMVNIITKDYRAKFLKTFKEFFTAIESRYRDSFRRLGLNRSSYESVFNQMDGVVRHWWSLTKEQQAIYHQSLLEDSKIFEHSFIDVGDGEYLLNPFWTKILVPGAREGQKTFSTLMEWKIGSLLAFLEKQKNDSESQEMLAFLKSETPERKEFLEKLETLFANENRNIHGLSHVNVPLGVKNLTNIIYQIMWRKLESKNPSIEKDVRVLQEALSKKMTTHSAQSFKGTDKIVKTLFFPYMVAKYFNDEALANRVWVARFREDLPQIKRILRADSELKAAYDRIYLATRGFTEEALKIAKAFYQRPLYLETGVISNQEYDGFIRELFRRNNLDLDDIFRNNRAMMSDGHKRLHSVLALANTALAISYKGGIDLNRFDLDIKGKMTMSDAAENVVIENPQRFNLSPVIVGMNVTKLGSFLNVMPTFSAGSSF